MGIVDSFLHATRLRRLQSQKRRIDSSYRKKIKQAESNNAGPALDDELHMEWMRESELVDEAIQFLHSNFLRSQAERYLLAEPEFDLKGTDWTTLRSHNFALTVRAIEELRLRIRREQKERWEMQTRWVPFLASTTGLIGTLIGLISVWFRY